MSFTRFTDDLNECLDAGIPLLFGWIHNNPSATGGQAKTAVKGWLDVSYPMFATQDFGSKLVDRLLPLADGTWAGFRSLVLTYHDFLEELFTEDISADEITLRSPAEMLKDWLIANGGTRSEIKDSSGEEWKRGFVISEGFTDSTYTVRQLYNPQFDGKRTLPNPQGWEII